MLDRRHSASTSDPRQRKILLSSRGYRSNQLFASKDLPKASAPREGAHSNIFLGQKSSVAYISRNAILLTLQAFRDQVSKGNQCEPSAIHQSSFPIKTSPVPSSLSIMSSGGKVDDITQGSQRHIKSPVPAAFREPPAAVDPAWIRQRKQKRLFLQARHDLEDLLKHMEAYIRGDVERHQARKYLPDPADVKTPRLPVLVKLFGLEIEYSACSYLLQRQQDGAQCASTELGDSEDWSVRVRDRRLEVDMGNTAVADVKLECMMELGDIKLWLSELSKRECDNPGHETLAVYRKSLIEDFGKRLQACFMALQSIDREQKPDAAGCNLITCSCPSCGKKDDGTSNGSNLRTTVSGSWQSSTDTSAVTTDGPGAAAALAGVLPNNAGLDYRTLKSRMYSDNAQPSIDITGVTNYAQAEKTEGEAAPDLQDWVVVVKGSL